MLAPLLSARRAERKGPSWTALLLPLLLALGPSPGRASCAPCWEWARAPSFAGHPTAPTFAYDLVLQAIAGDIYLLRESGNWAAFYNSPGLSRTPAFVALPDSDSETRFIFAAQTDGWLVKLAVPNPIPVAPQPLTLEIATTGENEQYRDMRRPACPSDTLLAEPVVQRRSDSNPQFVLDSDIVMVATAQACGSTHTDQVWALDAADITQPPLWVFNVGEYEIGHIRACLPDLERNRLHCVAEHPAGTFQPGLFSIDTNTGQLAWAGIFDTGAHARPALGAPGGPYAGYLYVGDQLGRLQSFDADDGSPLESITLVTAGDGVTPAVNLDVHVGRGDYAGMVFAVSSKGQISAIYDTTSELILAWESVLAGGQKIVTEAVPVEALGRIYAETDDGYFHQFNISSGSDESRGIIGVTQGGAATPDTTAIGVYEGANGIFHVVATLNDSSTGTTTKQYRLPCEYGGLDCVPQWLGFGDGFEGADP